MKPDEIARLLAGLPSAPLLSARPPKNPHAHTLVRWIKSGEMTFAGALDDYDELLDALKNTDIRGRMKGEELCTALDELDAIPGPQQRGGW